MFYVIKYYQLKKKPGFTSFQSFMVSSKRTVICTSMEAFLNI